MDTILFIIDVILFILAGVFWVFLCFIIACWNDELKVWINIFGNFLGKLLYNFKIKISILKIEMNNKFIDFWK